MHLSSELSSLMSCIESLRSLKCKYAKTTNSKNNLTELVYAKINALETQFRTKYFIISISMTLFGKISHASLFFYWPAVEPLADARGTLVFRGTPVENHCSNISLTFVK